MAVSRKKKGRKGRPRTLGPTLRAPKPVVSSLPPTPDDETQQDTSPLKWTDRPPEGHPDRSWYLPDNSKVRPIALQIIAMRLAGQEDKDIATALNISVNSISPYVYRATKNGWLDIDYDPKQRVQFQMMHKVVQRLEEGLDSAALLNTGMKERTAVALKVAEGTIFKQFGEQQTERQGNTIVAVQVVMPDGPRQTVRDETTGGVPAHIDAEVLHAVG